VFRHKKAAYAIREAIDHVGSNSAIVCSPVIPPVT